MQVHPPALSPLGLVERATAGLRSGSALEWAGKVTPEYRTARQLIVLQERLTRRFDIRWPAGDP